jgi:ABC-type multidrug transport system fused ATPase/permease subunit
MTRLWQLLTPFQRRLFVLLVIVNLVAAAAEVLGVFSVLPFLALAGEPDLAQTQPLLRAIYGYAGFSSSMAFLAAAGGVTITAIILTNIIAIASLWFRTWYCSKVMTEMSDRLLRGYLTQPYDFFLTHNSSVLGKDLLNEVQGFFTYALEPLTILLARLLQIAAIVVALLLFDWSTTLLAGLLFGGFYILSYVVLMKRIHLFGALRYEATDARYRLASEALSGMKEVKLFGRESWYATSFDKASEILVGSQGRLTLYSLTPRYVLEVLVFSSIVIAVLLKMAIGQSFRELAPSLSVFAVAGLRLLPSVQLVFQYAAALAAGATAIDRLHDLFKAVSALDGTPQLPAHVDQPLPLRKAMTIERVCFSYGTALRRVLDDVTLIIPAGACVGICGPSGSGKTTLMDTCLGLLTPSSGRILIDDVALTSASVAHWQRNIGYVPQSIYLIDGTIAENIAFSTDKTTIDMAAVGRAAALAHLTDVIEASERGFDTLVGERGVRLSGGQRQRVAIARALYRDPDVLFFDEATSALDSASEAQVVEAIQSLAHLKTIIVVAHRLTTLRYCDAIYELREGRIVRSGSYNDFVPHAPSASATH